MLAFKRNLTLHFFNGYAAATLGIEIAPQDITRNRNFIVARKGRGNDHTQSMKLNSKAGHSLALAFLEKTTTRNKMRQTQS